MYPRYKLSTFSTIDLEYKYSSSKLLDGSIEDSLSSLPIKFKLIKGDALSLTPILNLIDEVVASNTKESKGRRVVPSLKVIP